MDYQGEKELGARGQKCAASVKRIWMQCAASITTAEPFRGRHGEDFAPCWTVAGIREEGMTSDEF